MNHHRVYSLFILPAALLLLIVPLVYWVTSIRQISGGIFIYPVDDAYIHMELAKNLALHGTWGINPSEFASASSSPLYTLLLALLIRLFGNHIFLPLAINILAALVLIIVAIRWLQRQGLNATQVALIVMVLIIATPLPVLALSGMEHTLQILFSFLFLSRYVAVQKQRERGRHPASADVWRLSLWGMLMVTTRYECLFLLAPAVLLLFYRRWFLAGAQVLIVSCLPICLFGLYSLSKGSYFFPNSLMVKSNAAGASLSALPSLIQAILVDRFSFALAGVTLLATQRLLMILPLALLAFYRSSFFTKAYKEVLVILLVAVFLHLALADTGKFYRYEAYLIFSSLLFVIVCVCNWWKQRVAQPSLLQKVATVSVVLFLCLPLLLRCAAGFTKAQQACINIYEQQYQMARFIVQEKPAVVAANDIGAVSYFTNSTILDLWGLGNIEVAKAKKGHYWNAAFVNEIALKKNTDIVMVYDSWLKESLPPQWKKLGTWQINNNVVCGDAVVSFYAVSEAAAAEWGVKWKGFQSSLPSTVQVTVTP
jgi:hypothetical protein